MIENIVEPSLPKKRGRKKKVIQANKPNTETVNITITLEENDGTLQPNSETNLPKKRGRKPKGGKLVTKTQETNNSNNTIANIVLHLKCIKDTMQKSMLKIIHQMVSYNYHSLKYKYFR